jgi:hypothetical protein
VSDGGSEKKEQKKKGGKENDPSNVITEVLLQRYRGDLRYSRMHNQFFVYGGKHPGLWVSPGGVRYEGKGYAMIWKP